jgi:hypothetical protein
MTTATEQPATAKDIARAAGIGPRTRKVTIRDEYGSVISGKQRRYADVLAVLSRSDFTPDLSSRVHTVAYALRKCMTSARMPAESENRIADYSPYRLCALVARISRECPEETIGGICDNWLMSHHNDL